MKYIYQEDQVELSPEKISVGTDPVHGSTTIFHDVIIASEMVQPYPDGKAFKSRDELEAYTWTVDGRWVKAGAHPENAIISDRGDVSGRTVNAHYVKSLKDPKTGRPNRAGVRSDIEIFDSKVAPEVLDAMKKGLKRDVSIGFFFSKDDKPGVVADGPFKDEAYDYVQRNMFHDHLAVAIEDGRCPSPYCGLGADELRRYLSNDPFGGFSSWESCIAEVGAKNPKLKKEQVAKICGSIKAKSEKDNKEETALVKSLKALAEVLVNEMEELKGERDALKKDEKSAEWWKSIDWKTEEHRTIFDNLAEDTRQLIIDEGLCPDCKDEAKTEAERAMSHFKITEEEWAKLSEEQKQEYIKKLPKLSEEEATETIDEFDLEVDAFVKENFGVDAVLSYKQKAGHPDEDYAYIEEGCKKEDGKTEQRCRHLLIHDAVHVRAALAALSGARTGKVPPYADKAKPKVCAAAKKFKIESTVCGTEKKADATPPKVEAKLDPYAVLRRADEVLRKQ